MDGLLFGEKLGPMPLTTVVNTLQAKEPNNQGCSQDFSKGGSHCIKVRVLTRLSRHFHHLL